MQRSSIPDRILDDFQHPRGRFFRRFASPPKAATGLFLREMLANRSVAPDFLDVVLAPGRSRFVFLIPLLLACETPEFGTAYAWRRGGLTLHEQPAATSRAIARIAFGQAVRQRSAAPDRATVRIDAIQSGWRAVETGGKIGFLPDGFLARLPPPAACDSFANYLAGLEQSGDPLSAPLVEEIKPIKPPANAQNAPIAPEPPPPAAMDLEDIDLESTDAEPAPPQARKRTTTRYRNGITVVDEVAPRFASISITIENFPVIAGFELARQCNPIFFADLPFPGQNFRAERKADLRSSVDRARYSHGGQPLLIENQTETDEHIEKTTVHPLRKGAVRIKYYFAAL